jgi:hypothetical protein
VIKNIYKGIRERVRIDKENPKEKNEEKKIGQ